MKLIPRMVATLRTGSIGHTSAKYLQDVLSCGASTAAHTQELKSQPWGHLDSSLHAPLHAHSTSKTCQLFLQNPQPRRCAAITSSGWASDTSHHLYIVPPPDHHPFHFPQSCSGKGWPFKCQDDCVTFLFTSHCLEDGASQVSQW